MKKSSRRAISALLVLVMIVSLLPVSAFAAGSEGTGNATISVESVSAAPGSTVQVAVSIKDNPGILGARLSIEFDDGLTLISAKSGEAFSALQMSLPGKFESPCTFTWDGIDISEDQIQDGVILSLEFQVSEGVVSGSRLAIKLTATPNDFMDAQLNTVQVQTCDGNVTVINYIPGDVNSDQMITMADVIMLRRYLASGWDNLSIDEPAADVNDDMLITMADVILLRRYLASGWNVELKPSRLRPQGETCKHTLDEIVYQAPTCTAQGNIAYWHCTICDRYFTDVAAENATTLENTILAATGHTPNAAGTKCTVCGAALEVADDGKEYTISFYCPLAPQASIKRKITDRTPISDPENMNQYVFMGWTDINGNIVTEVEPGTKDITLYANWISHRNQTISNDYAKKGPIIFEDDENGQILFVYDIGKIINVPLYTIKDFGNTTSGIITKESESVTKSISSTTVDTITKTIVDATTDSATWTLSKEWNDLVTNTEDFSETNLEESSILISDGYTHTEGNTTNTGTVTDGGTLEKNNTTTKDLTTTKIGSSKELDIGVDIGKKSWPVKAEIDAKFERHKDTTDEDGTIKDEGTDTYNLTHTNDLTTSIDHTTTSYVRENQSKIAQEISKQWHYSIAKSTGETSGESKTSDVSHSNSETVSSSFSYTVEEETTNVKEYSTEKAVPGYHRLVCAGTVHVFAVVGFDIATHQYYYYSYSVLDDETHEFWDYSKNNAEYNDYEAGVLPFAVPISVHDYVFDKIYLSNGLEVNDQTGVITGYSGESTYVNIPDYYSRDNGDGTVTVVKITGIDAGVFRNNTEVKTVKLSKYITEIPAGAFEGCTALKKVLYQDLTSIGERAFSGCTSLGKFTVANSVKSMGTKAFEGVTEVVVNAKNADVAIAASSSGAKKLTINLPTDGLHDARLEISESTDDVTINGYKRTYKNIEILSNCARTSINGIYFSDNTGVPLTVEGGTLTLTNVNVTNAKGYAFVLGQDPQKEYTKEYAPVNIILNGISTVSTSGDIAILSRDLTLNKQSGVTVQCKLKVPTGKVAICGAKLGETDRKYLDALDSQIDYLELDQFNRILHFYTLTLDANGGTCSETKLEKTPGMAVGTLPTPTREYYTFDGWYTSAEGGTEVTAGTVFSTGEDVTIYAHWLPIAYKVTWNTGTGYQITVSRTSSPNAGAPTGTLNSGATVYYGDVLSVNYTAQTGYSLSSTGEKSISVNGDVTASRIYASASANSYTYNVVYQSVNGTALGSTTVTNTYGTTNTVSAPAYNGYITPGAQQITWDSTSAKTITFAYTPSSVGSTVKTGTAISSPKITYSATLEHRNRTATSVEFRVTWTATIEKGGYDAYGQRFEASCGSNKTGAVQIVKFGTWSNSSSKTRSATATSDWVTVPVSTTNATSLSIDIHYYQVNSPGSKMGTDMKTTWQMEIPAY